MPIIFITADYGDEVRTAKGYSLGAVDYMVSPIVPEILRTKVKVFVDLYPARADREAPGAGAGPARRGARGARPPPSARTSGSRFWRGQAPRCPAR